MISFSKSMPNYEKVRAFLLRYPDRFFSKREIAEAAGLQLYQASNVIRCAWRLGWVERLEQPLNDNAFGTGKYRTLRTRYRIKMKDEWVGIVPLYKKKIMEDKKKKNAGTNKAQS
jgi:hypothetical protein